MPPYLSPPAGGVAPEDAPWPDRFRSAPPPVEPVEPPKASTREPAREEVVRAEGSSAAERPPREPVVGWPERALADLAPWAVDDDDRMLLAWAGALALAILLWAGGVGMVGLLLVLRAAL